MGNLVVTIGTRIIDIVFILACASVILGGIIWMFSASGFWNFLYICFLTILALCGVIMGFFLVYLLIDMREKLRQIAEK